HFQRWKDKGNDEIEDKRRSKPKPAVHGDLKCDEEGFGRTEVNENRAIPQCLFGQRWIVVNPPGEQLVRTDGDGFNANGDKAIGSERKPVLILGAQLKDTELV